MYGDVVVVNQIFHQRDVAELSIELPLFIISNSVCQLGTILDDVGVFCLASASSKLGGDGAVPLLLRRGVES